ncbi:ISAs1 family transposase [Streptomyces sp. NPDC056291]|uniref:ISAs1 family transposase n=1 Tax=Streptomyces sp. NPDC056291 TaxID=3345772 RepID=UPI0035D9322E
MPSGGLTRRYRLGSPLALCLLAVLGGAITLAGIARFATDAPSDVRTRIGLGGLPRATTLGRLLSRIDGDALDDAIGVWLARHAADPVEDDQPLVGLTADGKTVRGSRSGDQKAVHLPAAVLHESQAVISQRQTAAKSNEIPAFVPLLDQLDLHGHVITADAMHTQTDHAEQITSPGAHYILVVKGNKKSSAVSCGDCPGARSRFSTASANGRTGAARYAASKSARSSRVCFSARRTGHRGQAPSHESHDREDHRQDDLRGHQPHFRAGHRVPTCRTDPWALAGRGPVPRAGRNLGLRI